MLKQKIINTFSQVTQRVIQYLRKEKIDLAEPSPYQNVDISFNISGWVPWSWVRWLPAWNSYMVNVEIFDVNGSILQYELVHILNDVEDKKSYNKLYFSEVIHLHQNSFRLNPSQGRINVRLFGKNKEKQSVFIPLVAGRYSPEGGADKTIIKKHRRLEKTVRKFEKDLGRYYRGLAKINLRRRNRGTLSNGNDSFNKIDNEHKIAFDLFSILEEEKCINKKYPPIYDDLAEKRLEEKYSEAIHWNPNYGNKGGRVGSMDGFLFMVLSDDHGKHFHVLHKGNGIDARFSYPEIQLINYKTKNFINRKTEKRIISYFKNQEHFDKLKKEFEKRDGIPLT
jgi:hypothetical protein